MSKEEKQLYLRESIMNDGLDTEKFINFMESDPDRGADLDRYDLSEIKNVIQIERRRSTRSKLPMG